MEVSANRPAMVWGIGLNYRDHIAETGREVPQVPVVFAKSPHSVIGHTEPILIPEHVTCPDYEGEVAVVIGRTCRDVSETDAWGVIRGLTCGHDVSARDQQYLTPQWSWSKSFDTFCPLGPRVVALEDLGPSATGSGPLALAIQTRLNGEVVQSSNTREMVFSIPALVAWLSRGVTLAAGDVILTGTPGGVGAARTPPRWLVNGDEVEVEVEGIGTLRNRVRRSRPG